MQVTVERLDAIDEENRTETIHAKFVVGTDGKSHPPHFPALALTFCP